ncbi:hypothetical protein SAMN04488105_111163 [Salipiger thiooxidans]|uniref:Uncharacterized protein n=1 Tax=Salipiger thiooxidans TaxID=282683 RepID=A0A1G7HUP1_9RHOB|nr:hypothetical protein [Salipiger thiooxidans]SDF03904.1 hypothetical protein SAMN04488105_111163 [Salipiger thiooxidans]
MFEPTPVLLAFLIFKRFVFLELVAALALARVIRATGPSRLAALGALFLASVGAAILLAPMAGLDHGPVYAAGARFMAMGSGMLPLLLPSVLLALSAYVPGSRHRGIDIAHIVALWVLVGLWLASVML